METQIEGSEWEMKAEWILRQFLSGRGAPHTLEIHPTFRCNLHCVFCLQEEARREGLVDFDHELTTEQWLTLVRDAASRGVKEVRICGGGEPMYDPKASMRLFEEIKRNGMDGYLTTNATMFNDEIVEFMVRSGWERIEFSIDSPHRETHDRLRGVKGSFDRAVQAVRKVCEIRAAMGKDSPFVVINMVVMNCNYREIPQMVDLFGQMGADQLLLLTLHHRGDIGDTLTLSPEDMPVLRRAIIQAKNAAMRFGLEVCSHNIDAERAADGKSKDELLIPDTQVLGRGVPARADAMRGDPRLIQLLTLPCYEPWYYLQVCHDGIYSPCCNSYRNEDGETFHDLPFAHIWSEGKHMNRVRQNLLSNRFEGVCKECDRVHLVRTSMVRRHLLRICEQRGLLPQETIEMIRRQSDNILDLGGAV